MEAIVQEWQVEKNQQVAIRVDDSSFFINRLKFN
jgi:flagella basal body P-ring formation protein FlgA